MGLFKVTPFDSARGFKRWFFEGMRRRAGGRKKLDRHHQHAWWKVMCLTGVDYFSTLGYQPGIAFLAAGVLSPLATVVLVALTIFGALPVYRHVADRSPHGEGSISMLESVLSRWRGKLFVLVLLGFVATDFIITITLSAADAAAHIIENPFTPAFLHHRLGVTLLLITVLGAIFLKGFKEAIGIAVLLVSVYLALTLIIVFVGLIEIASDPLRLPSWKTALLGSYGSPLAMIGAALIVFPRLALGLSGFETGVVIMRLVRGEEGENPDRPVARIRNTKKLLATAAAIMSVMLILSSLVTTLLIPAGEFPVGGKANGRALSYLAHELIGDAFGTAYDLSTIAILWFAGASALAGLLNIVPRYLPRYGMAPEWARALRPLTVVYTLIAFAVTIIFDADVDAQGGAYATGVLVLMTSASIAVTLSVWREPVKRYAFIVISAIFCYTTVLNVIERPEGVKIASFFIAATIVTSLISRVMRSTELRVESVELDAVADEFIEEAAAGSIRIVANRRDRGDLREYQLKEREKREDNHIPEEDPIIFFEVSPSDASNFAGVLKISGVKVNGYRVLRTESPAVPNAIAAFLLYLRNRTSNIPHIYFGWSEGNPLSYLLRYLVFGEGDTAPVTREVLRQAEEDPEKRPAVHVGG